MRDHNLRVALVKESLIYAKFVGEVFWIPFVSVLWDVRSVLNFFSFLSSDFYRPFSSFQNCPALSFKTRTIVVIPKSCISFLISTLCIPNYYHIILPCSFQLVTLWVYQDLRSVFGKQLNVFFRNTYLFFIF